MRVHPHTGMLLVELCKKLVQFVQIITVNHFLPDMMAEPEEISDYLHHLRWHEPFYCRKIELYTWLNGCTVEAIEGD